MQFLVAIAARRQRSRPLAKARTFYIAAAINSAERRRERFFAQFKPHFLKRIVAFVAVAKHAEDHEHLFGRGQRLHGPRFFLDQLFYKCMMHELL